MNEHECHECIISLVVCLSLLPCVASWDWLTNKLTQRKIKSSNKSLWLIVVTSLDPSSSGMKCTKLRELKSQVKVKYWWVPHCKTDFMQLLHVFTESPGAYFTFSRVHTLAHIIFSVDHFQKPLLLNKQQRTLSSMKLTNTQTITYMTSHDKRTWASLLCWWLKPAPLMPTLQLSSTLSNLWP